MTKTEKNIPKSVNMASRCNHAIQRVLAKLEASINSENYYEAHQMYRTLYFRWASNVINQHRQRIIFIQSSI